MFFYDIQLNRFLSTIENAPHIKGLIVMFSDGTPVLNLTNFSGRDGFEKAVSAIKERLSLYWDGDLQKWRYSLNGDKLSPRLWAKWEEESVQISQFWHILNP